MNNLKPKTMSEAKEAIIDFLTDQLAVNTEQLREYIQITYCRHLRQMA